LIARRFVLVIAAAAVLVLGFVYVQTAEPGWWVRVWYPLKYETIVRGHARNYRLDPALLAAVI
jgi:hypothetical protein